MGRIFRDGLLHLATDAMERRLVPDALIRAGIRQLCRMRIAGEQRANCEQQVEALSRFVRALDQAPIAPMTQLANDQHYEWPPEFFAGVLGKHLKYSCCWFSDPEGSLDEAESAALEATTERAQVQDGMRVLELGCGWGSLSLWIAERYPGCEVLAVSNSHSQRKHIEREAVARGISNLRVVTADMNNFDTELRFDRVVSVEMFEHMRNYRELMSRVSSWLRPGGKLFLHIFVHRDFAYTFEQEGEDNWMGRHFFSGGIMPSDSLPLYFQEALKLEQRWRWSGLHYAQTADAWLANMDAHRDELFPILLARFGDAEAERWWQRWRMFFMACSELFGFEDGEQWWVAHYRFKKADAPGARGQAGSEEARPHH